MLFQSLTDKIQPSQLDIDFTSDHLQEKLQLLPVSDDEIKKQILKISDSKATAEDGVPIRFVKLATNTSTTLKS